MAWPDRHRDHVLLQPLVIPDAGIEAAREDIDEAVVRHHIDTDFRIADGETRQQRGQDQLRYADRYIEPQRAARRIGGTSRDIERAPDLG
jgi:hypothetical protein